MDFRKNIMEFSFFHEKGRSGKRGDKEMKNEEIFKRIENFKVMKDGRSANNKWYRYFIEELEDLKWNVKRK